VFEITDYKSFCRVSPKGEVIGPFKSGPPIFLRYEFGQRGLFGSLLLSCVPAVQGNEIDPSDMLQVEKPSPYHQLDFTGLTSKFFPALLPRAALTAVLFIMNS
jgi:hypothetical protein